MSPIDPIVVFILFYCAGGGGVFGVFLLISALMNPQDPMGPKPPRIR